MWYLCELSKHLITTVRPESNVLGSARPDRHHKAMGNKHDWSSPDSHLLGHSVLEAALLIAPAPVGAALVHVGVADDLPVKECSLRVRLARCSGKLIKKATAPQPSEQHGLTAAALS